MTVRFKPRDGSRSPNFHGPDSGSYGAIKPLLAAIALSMLLMLAYGAATAQVAGKPGAAAPTPAPAAPAFKPLVNPLNRNPDARDRRLSEATTLPDPVPEPIAADSSSRPTLGAVTRPDTRDTVVAPDPSRDGTPAGLAR